MGFNFSFRVVLDVLRWTGPRGSTIRGRYTKRIEEGLERSVGGRSPGSVNDKKEFYEQGVYRYTELGIERSPEISFQLKRHSGKD